MTSINQSEHGLTTSALGSVRQSVTLAAQSRWALYAGRLLLLAGFIAFWQVSLMTGLGSKAFISSPSDVFNALWVLLAEGRVLTDLGTTATEVAISFVASVILGIGAAVVLDRNELLRELLSPYIAALNSMPRIALGPIFILWFGIGMASKIVLAASLGFFIVLVSTLGGLRTVDRDMLLMSRLYGGSNLQLFWFVRLPWALPSVFAGLKLTLIYCTGGSIIGEMIAARSGLGLLIQTFSGQFDIASVFAVMLIIIVCVVVVTAMFEWIERILLGWARGTTDVPG